MSDRGPIEKVDFLLQSILTPAGVTNEVNPLAHYMPGIELAVGLMIQRLGGEIRLTEKEGAALAETGKRVRFEHFGDETGPVEQRGWKFSLMPKEDAEKQEIFDNFKLILEYLDALKSVAREHADA